MTRRMALIGEAMDVAVLDHLVLAGSQCTSMRSMGLL
jgi:DNA repair protein RadC